MKRFLAAIRFLTIAPVPGTWGTGEGDLAGSIPFFPLVGLLLGVVVAGIAWTLSLASAPLLGAALLVIVLLAFSGGLHTDGLSDTADGFLSSRPRERILEIMKDSHVGAMGVIAIVVVLMTKFAALASVPSRSLWIAAGLMPLAGRCVMVLHMAVLPYARPGGLGKIFCRKRPWGSAILSTVVLAGACVGLLGVRGLVVAAACVVVALLMAAWSYRKIGGATGDTFGAACEVVETVPAIMLALWPIAPLPW